jgi:hypothetical protein
MMVPLGNIESYLRGKKKKQRLINNNPNGDGAFLCN